VVPTVNGIALHGSSFTGCAAAIRVKKLENNYGIIFPKISDSLKACLKNIKP
jgi:hypothetical protein